MKNLSLAYPLALTLMTAIPAQAQSSMESAPAVTVDNFARAETDMYFAEHVKQGMFGKIVHALEVAAVDKQTVIRPNRDTLYSLGVFDLDAGALKVTLPDTKRFMALQVINEDHYVPQVVYGHGEFTFTKRSVGTRYVMLGIRTLVDPNDPKDVEQVHALQDRIKVSQANPGKFVAPNWDKESQKKIRDALLVLGSTLPDFRNSFGTKQDVDPIRHLIATATAWGGNPDRDATYLNTLRTETTVTRPTG